MSNVLALQVYWTRHALERWRERCPGATTIHLTACVRSARRPTNRELRACLGYTASNNVPGHPYRLGFFRERWWLFPLEVVSGKGRGVRVLTVMDVTDKLQGA